MIVKLKSGVVSAMADGSQGLKYQSSVGALGAQVYKITDNTTVDEKIKQLEAHPCEGGCVEVCTAAVAYCLPWCPSW